MIINNVTFVGNNTCHASRKISEPGRVFCFYDLGSNIHKTSAIYHRSGSPTQKAEGYSLRMK